MTNADTIAELKDRGYFPYIQHIRATEAVHPGRFDTTRRTAACGGRTVVQIFRSEDVGEHDATQAPINPVARGFAICHPKDNYNRKRGLQIALARAITDLDTPKREHELVDAPKANEILEGLEEAREEILAS